MFLAGSRVAVACSSPPPMEDIYIDVLTRRREGGVSRLSLPRSKLNNQPGGHPQHMHRSQQPHQYPHAIPYALPPSQPEPQYTFM
jgi:hypothetical protein